MLILRVYASKSVLKAIVWQDLSMISSIKIGRAWMFKTRKVWTKPTDKTKLLNKYISILIYFRWNIQACKLVNYFFFDQITSKHKQQFVFRTFF